MAKTDDIVAHWTVTGAPTEFIAQAAAALADRDAQIERLTRDETRLRKALAECAVYTGGHADGATVDFLMHVPENVRLHVERLEKGIFSLERAELQASVRATAAEREIERLTREVAKEKDLHHTMMQVSADQSARATTAERERDEALNELHMKWCMACGTLTNDDDCDCTMYGDLSLQELRPYIEEYQNSMRECLSKAERERDEARAEVERKDAALREARENMEAWAAYASDYFKEKHDLEGDLAKIDAALTKGGADGDA